MRFTSLAVGGLTCFRNTLAGFRQAQSLSHMRIHYDDLMGRVSMERYAPGYELRATRHSRSEVVLM